MKTPVRLIVFLLLTCFLLCPRLATAVGQPLNIYWIDVEGGGCTLIVTPAGESVLIDTGWPWPPGPARIRAAAAAAGVSRIDYLVLTHFHLDHFGGAAPLTALMPIGVVLDNGVPDHDPDGEDDARFLDWIKPYREFKADRRALIQPGATIPLKQSGAAVSLTLTFMGARKHFAHPPGMGGPNSIRTATVSKAADTTDNANSAVLLLQFGPFKFYDGGDLTWNMEGEMIWPTNSFGCVDVCQVDHHGVNLSSNPLLIRSLAPTVTVMNNGARKGGDRETIATLRSVPSIQAMWQIHRDTRGGADFNTDDQHIANLREKCDGNCIQCSVDPSGKSYTFRIPASGFARTYQTRAAGAADP